MLDSRPVDERPLRIVFFGHSIVSAWNNSTAGVSRELLRELNKLGHETRFLEERGNRATVGLLRESGSAPFREFARDYPDIVYRTYELPKGVERTIWLAREVGDVDVVVAIDDAPPELLDELAGVPLPRLVKVILLRGISDLPFTPDIVLSVPDRSTDMAAFAASLVDQVTKQLIVRRSVRPN